MWYEFFNVFFMWSGSFYVVKSSNSDFDSWIIECQSVLYLAYFFTRIVSSYGSWEEAQSYSSFSLQLLTGFGVGVISFTVSWYLPLKQSKLLKVINFWSLHVYGRQGSVLCLYVCIMHVFMLLSSQNYWYDRNLIDKVWHNHFRYRYTSLK